MSQAQIFLTFVLSLVISFKHLKNYVTRCQTLINTHDQKQKAKFFAKFFNKSNESSPTNFEREFNDTIIHLHIEASKHNIFVPCSPLSLPYDNSCVNCQYSLEVADDSYYCVNCGCTINIPNAPAYSDVSRVQSTPNYTYDRKVQFKEFLLLYQGKYDKVDAGILKKLVIKPEMTKTEFFYLLKNVTKERIYFDNVHILFYKALGKTPPDLTAVENMLVNDFEQFSNLFSQNSLNVTVPNSFLVYQFLNRYGYYTTKDDLLLIDTLDSTLKKSCSEIFKELGWRIVE